MDPFDPTEPVAAPYAGFELQVLVDRAVYATGEPVRITVAATNGSDRFVEHHYPGWQRYELTVRDAAHRVVADDVVERRAATPAVDRWLPGQRAIWPTYWSQASGPMVEGRVVARPGPRPEPGRYRVRLRWLGREPGWRERPDEVTSPWFELV